MKHKASIGCALEIPGAWVLHGLLLIFCSDGGEPGSPIWEESIAWIRKAATAQEPLGMYYLGRYLMLQGPYQDFTEARTWVTRAAEARLAKARVALGTCLLEGAFGGVPEPLVAVAWFRSAAEQGDARGQVCLGKCYEEGQGVPEDQAQAIAWFRKTAHFFWKSMGITQSP